MSQIMKALRFTLLLLLFVWGFAAPAFSQNPQLDWAVADGGSGFDIGRAVALDAQGNAYAAGYFQGTADFDPSPATLNLVSAGDNDVFVQKLDAQGNLLWARSVGSAMVDEAKSIALDAQGNVYVSGRFSGTVDFDPGTGLANATAAGMTDIFVLKLDANGDFVWARTVGGAGTDEGTSIYADASGVYVSGYFQGAVDFDPGVGTNMQSSNSGTMDFFVLHWDATGVHQWAYGFGANGLEYSFAVTRGPSGEVYATGCFQDTVDFDAGNGVSNLIADPGVTAAYVLNLHANGSFGWARQIGTSGYTIGYGLATSAAGTLYMTGGINGSIDFDPGPGTNAYASAASYDVWVEKMTPQGGYLDAWAYGGIGDDYGYGIAVTPSCALYVGGGYGATVDFDASSSGTYNITSFNNTFDAFIERTDTAGNFAWARSIGGGDIEYVFGLAADATDHVLTTGCFGQTVDFDTEAGVLNITTLGNADIFVHKIKQCAPSSGSISLSGCDSLQVNGQMYYATGTYTQTLQNIAGCDSTLTLTLTIHSSTAATITDSACVSYSINGFTYTGSGTYIQLLNNAWGCDSVLTLQLTIQPVDTTVLVFPDHLEADYPYADNYQWLDCDNGFLPIAGAIDSTYFPAFTSHFAVQITQNGCVDTSACYYLNTVAMQEDLSMAWTLSPNPTQGSLKLSMGLGEAPRDISIYNAWGECIWQAASTLENRIELPASHGMYFVKVASGGVQRTFKINRE